MSSVKKWVVGACAGMAACGSAIALAQQAGPAVVVGTQSQAVQTPTTAGISGISYSQITATASSLAAYTKGFMFCGNVLPPSTPPNSSPSSLTIAHEDQGFTPAHPWTFAPLTDVETFHYNSGLLNVVPGPSLTCLATAEDGAVVSGLNEGIFDNGYDSATETNYSHLVNWIPPAGFSWLAPDWSAVPKDPCNPSANDPAKVNEDIACAAVTGVRRSVTTPVARAGTIWTATDGSNFTYLFRVDARLGPQQSPTMAAPFNPAVLQGEDVTGVPAAAVINIVDAYDSAFLHGGANAGGQYCILTTPPTALNAGVCSGSSNVYQLNGGNLAFAVNLAPQPIGIDATTFYVAVTRSVMGGHLSSTPVVAVAALMDKATVGEGGDKFTGDDVAFGFMPTSQGFPWMSGN